MKCDMFVYYFIIIFLHHRSGDVDVMLSEEDHARALGGLRELLNSVCDHAHDRCCKVLTARAKVGPLSPLLLSSFNDVRYILVFLFYCLCFLFLRLILFYLYIYLVVTR